MSRHAIHGDYSASYQYDKVGNRIYETVDAVQIQYTYDDNDRLTQVGGTIYSYDSNGNTISTMSDGQATLYSYNAKNHLINVTSPDLSYSDYSYNIDGIRISKGENGTVTDYIVDSNRDYAQVLEEVLNGTTVVTYIYGDDLISQQREGNTFFYHYDGLGSTRALSDAVGTLTDTWDYEAFEEVLNRIGDTENSYLFVGEQYDSALDQYYLRARYYDQTVGRFTQMDAWMGNNYDPITLHKYLYANADPVTYADPSGNFSIGGMMSSINVMGNLATTAVRTAGTRLGGSAVGRAIKATGVYMIGALIKKEAKRCYVSRGKKCRIPNLVVIGSMNPESQQHVRDAQFGNGSNGIPISPLVAYKKGANKSRAWLSKTPECGGKTGGITGKDCDEYPFATTNQGGKSRYRSYQVSLRPIDSCDNQCAGRVWGRAVRKGKNGDKYLIAPYGPVSLYYSNGKFCL